MGHQKQSVNNWHLNWQIWNLSNIQHLLVVWISKHHEFNRLQLNHSKSAKVWPPGFRFHCDRVAQSDVSVFQPQLQSLLRCSSTARGRNNESHPFHSSALLYVVRTMLIASNLQSTKLSWISITCLRQNYEGIPPSIVWVWEAILPLRKARKHMVNTFRPFTC